MVSRVKQTTMVGARQARAKARRMAETAQSLMLAVLERKTEKGIDCSTGKLKWLPSRLFHCFEELE
jgi:hypothetical protein